MGLKPAVQRTIHPTRNRSSRRRRENSPNTTTVKGEKSNNKRQGGDSSSVRTTTTTMSGLVTRRIGAILAFFSVQIMLTHCFSVFPPQTTDLARCLPRPRLLPRCSAANDSNDDDVEFLEVEESAAGEPWETVGMISTMVTPWLTLHGERLRDNQGQLLDYWRVEKEHSVVIVTLHRNRLVFPRPQYRPGVGQSTLDFPGGRVPRAIETVDGIQTQVVPRILQRELGLGDMDDSKDACQDIFCISGPEGWIINSSFSNQRLYGFVAVIRDDVELDSIFLHPKSYDLLHPEHMQVLLNEDLKCLQCRHVLLEYVAGGF
eukprot:scaffold34620_cov160-Amphora_coffeaeformis.AAC.4